MLAKCLWPVAALLVLASICFPRTVQASAGSAGQTGGSESLQNIFAQAAREFRVPEPVLLSVAYNESRWEQHGGAPNTSGGYGIMNLTSVDRLPELMAKGDGVVRWFRDVRRDGALHTLEAAAELVHVSPRALRYDPAQNVRAGAALLARYARETLGHYPSSVGEWYGAVARYSGSTDAAEARSFASDVYATISRGEARWTADGQFVQLTPANVRPDLRTVAPLHLRQAQTHVDCPAQVDCRFVPAAYRVNNPNDPTDYGNYDAANRTKNGLAIRYVVIHDTEGSYDAAVSTFQNPTRYASANYVMRSADGQVTEMVRPRNIAWHSGNYWFNMHSVGIEHEGVAIEGATWYTEQMYNASARLLLYLAKKYQIPLDRAHIVGHDDVPGPTPDTQSTQHWDPGPYWDWDHYMQLLNATIEPATDTTTIVTIAPAYAFNQPPVTYCYSQKDCRAVAPQPSNFVYLHVAPSDTAPLIGDPALHAKGEPGTTRANDWGDKAVTGQQFHLIERRGDWDGIDFGGQEAWFFNPQSSTAIPGDGELVTPKPGATSIPVYGRPYPEASAYPSYIKTPEKIVPLQYTIPAGAQYVFTDLVHSDFYWSPTQKRHAVVHGHTMYYQIFFNHRLAFVKKSDVVVVAPASRGVASKGR